MEPACWRRIGLVRGALIVSSLAVVAAVAATSCCRREDENAGQGPVGANATTPVFPEDEFEEIIAGQRARISALNTERTGPIPWNSRTIATNLTRDLDEDTARRVLFQFVRDFPYRIRSWESNAGCQIYDEECGDCRHKREALYHLYQCCGFEVRKVAVVFNWADLPIPKEILAIRAKSGTRAFHSGMDVKVNGEWVRVDPTWDRGLADLGFPVTVNWDGVSPTKEVTAGSCPRVPHGDYETLDELRERFGVPYAVSSETRRFATELNEWLGAHRN